MLSFDKEVVGGDANNSMGLSAIFGLADNLRYKISTLFTAHDQMKI